MYRRDPLKSATLSVFALPIPVLARPDNSGGMAAAVRAEFPTPKLSDTSWRQNCSIALFPQREREVRP